MSTQICHNLHANMIKFLAQCHPETNSCYTATLPLLDGVIYGLLLSPILISHYTMMYCFTQHYSRLMLWITTYTAQVFATNNSSILNILLHIFSQFLTGCQGFTLLILNKPIIKQKSCRNLIKQILVKFTHKFNYLSLLLASQATSIHQSKN